MRVSVLFLAAVTLLGSFAAAEDRVDQATVDAAMAKLLARPRAISTRPLLTTRPTATMPAAKGPKTLRLKAGAPAAVEEWFRAQPEYKAGEKIDLESRIKAREADIKKIQEQPVGTIVTGRSPAGETREADMKEAEQRYEQVKKMKEEVASEKREMRRIDDPLYVVIPELKLSIGSMGYYYGSFKIIQVLDKGSALAEIGDNDQVVELKNLSTVKLFDDVVIKYDMPLAVTGTTNYINTLNSKRTVLVLEPFPCMDYLDIVDANGVVVGGHVEPETAAVNELAERRRGPKSIIEQSLPPREH